jgi:hemin uptake protein HemP
MIECVKWTAGQKIPAKAVADSPRNPHASQENPGLAGRPESAALPAAGERTSDEPGPILSELLLRGRNEIQILHRGELYRLCLTRAGKLILHK